MLVNVKGVDIEINDTLAKKYEEMFFEPINEKTILTYIRNDSEKLNTKIIEKIIKEDIILNGGVL